MYRCISIRARSLDGWQINKRETTIGTRTDTNQLHFYCGLHSPLGLTPPSLRAGGGAGPATVAVAADALGLAGGVARVVVVGVVVVVVVVVVAVALGGAAA